MFILILTSSSAQLQLRASTFLLGLPALSVSFSYPCSTDYKSNAMFTTKSASLHLCLFTQCHNYPVKTRSFRIPFATEFIFNCYSFSHFGSSKLDLITFNVFFSSVRIQLECLYTKTFHLKFH